MGGIPISRVDPTCYQMAFFFGVASGNLLQFAIENGPVEIVDLPIQKGMIFYSKLLVYQRVQVPFSDSGRSGHLFASPGGLSFHRLRRQARCIMGMVMGSVSFGEFTDICWLVASNMLIIFPYIGNVIIPTD